MNEQTLQSAFNSLGYVNEGFLGGGRYGNVYQVSKLSGARAEKYAIKLLDTENRNKLDSQKYNDREVKLLKTLDIRDQNVVQYYEHWDIAVGGTPYLCIRMELCWRNLFTFVYNNNMGGAEIVKAPGKPRLYQQVFPQILEGLKAIHSRGWVHRDIHYGNILVTTPKPSTISEIRIKIADFGLAREIKTTSKSDETLSPFTSLGPFSAPELSSRTYDKKVDLYSAGIVLYFLTRYLKDKRQWEEEIRKLKNEGPFYNHLCFRDDATLITLIMSLTNEDPKKRKTAEGALKKMKESADTSLQDTENSESTGTSFLVKKASDEDWKRGTCKNDTWSSLTHEIYSITGVEPKLQELLQETKMTLPGSDEPQRITVEINNDYQVEQMILSASTNQKRVCIVVQENMDISP